jgi:hypothetical protein
VKAFWAQWLAAVSRSAIGVDSDPALVWRASKRFAVEWQCVRGAYALRNFYADKRFSMSSRSWQAFTTCRYVIAL